MTSQRTLESLRIEMNGAWYLSSEQIAGHLETDIASITERKDFQLPGHFIIYDGVHFYSEAFCRELMAQNSAKPPSLPA
jgi:hypothetical protein